MVLTPLGKVSSCNPAFLARAGVEEGQMVNRDFARFFDCQEGSAALHLAVRNAARGVPSPVSFSLTGQSQLFSGMVLPVYEEGQHPVRLLVLTRGTHVQKLKIPSLPEREENLDKAFSPISGTRSAKEKDKPKMTSAPLLLVEDRDGLIPGIFNKMLKSKSASVRMASDTEQALEMAADFRPGLVVSTRNPAGVLDWPGLSDQLRKNLNIPTLFLTRDGQKIRLEDGWLDLHIRFEGDPAKNIMDLIRQFY